MGGNEVHAIALQPPPVEWLSSSIEFISHSSKAIRVVVQTAV